MRQTIRFRTSPDEAARVRDAWQRPPLAPLVRVGTWLTHLQDDRDSPLWHRWLDGLADGRTLLRYDERSSGLSDRNVSRFSVDGWAEDLDAVVDLNGGGVVDPPPFVNISRRRRA